MGAKAPDPAPPPSFGKPPVPPPPPPYRIERRRAGPSTPDSVIRLVHTLNQDLKAEHPYLWPLQHPQLHNSPMSADKSENYEPTVEERQASEIYFLREEARNRKLKDTWWAGFVWGIVWLIFMGLIYTAITTGWTHWKFLQSQ